MHHLYYLPNLLTAPTQHRRANPGALFRACLCPPLTAYHGRGFNWSPPPAPTLKNLLSTVGNRDGIISGALHQGFASRPTSGAPLTQRTGYDGGNYANNATFCAFLRVFCAFWVDLLQKTCISPTPPALAPEGRGSATQGKIICRPLCPAAYPKDVAR